ncbi:coiled-coil domain-containing protein 157 [Esox lucius]|uniref:coiled-coil domain-containing protein 157 n=1 Tax=Esox lucius TaxID=8010 RepID=UPI0014776087|nr:coiled-coil domain-containing protein 157 [Esox lucius]
MFSVGVRSGLQADTRNVNCQTVESSLIPCDACAQVQSSLRETGDALVKLCRSEGIPCSLQRLLVAVDETLERGWLTAGDVAQWSAEQCRDMGRLGKHLLEVRSTVRPLRESLQAAEGEREEFRAQLRRAQEELKCERATHQTSRQQLEKRLQEAEASREETERRLQEEKEELRRGTLSLEVSISKLKTEIRFQQERLHKLESERDELHHEVKGLQVEADARLKLEEKTQMLEAQLCATQLLLDKENSKYQNACRQQESLQAKQMSLLERLDALDQECEELQGQLEESEGRQTELQDRLTHISEEKEKLQTQLTQEQASCSELQQEKQRLESHVMELKTSVDQLTGEVQELAQRERLLVAFPELNPLPLGPPQSTGDVLGDMEQQLQANCVRIRVLEQENSTLRNSLMKLRNIAQLVSPNVGSGTTSPSSCGFSQPLHDTPGDGRLSRSSDVHHSVLQSSRAGVSSLPACTPPVHRQTPWLSPDTSAVRTHEKIRQAPRPRSLGMHQGKK